MRFFKVILFSIIVNVPFFRSAEEVTYEERNYENIYVSMPSSEQESMDLLKKMNKDMDTFDYISGNNKSIDPRNSIFVVIIDNEKVLKNFLFLLSETTKVTLKDIETSEDDVFEYILLKTTFIMNKYKDNFMKLLKSLFKKNLSLILNINEINPTITILCDSPKKIYVKNDLIKSYSSFIKTQLQSSKYEDVQKMCDKKEIREYIINIMITQFLNNVVYSSLLLFPQEEFCNSLTINTFIYTRKPLTKNSQKLENEETITRIKKIMK